MIDLFSNSGNGAMSVFSTVGEGRSPDAVVCVSGSEVTGVLTQGVELGTASVWDAERNFALETVNPKRSLFLS